MLDGEIFPTFFKVYGTEATSWGSRKIDVKFFSTRETANKYAGTLVGDLRKQVEESPSDDMDFIAIEDEKEQILEAWREENGQIVHYPDGWEVR